MKELNDLKKEIYLIKKRNKNVEADKAWETSWTRRIIIFILTYIVIVIFFYFARLPNPFLNSIVPAVAFILSTLTLPLFKKIWLKRYKNESTNNNKKYQLKRGLASERNKLSSQNFKDINNK